MFNSSATNFGDIWSIQASWLESKKVVSAHLLSLPTWQSGCLQLMLPAWAAASGSFWLGKRHAPFSCPCCPHCERNGAVLAACLVALGLEAAAVADRTWPAGGVEREGEVAMCRWTGAVFIATAINPWGLRASTRAVKSQLTAVGRRRKACFMPPWWFTHVDELAVLAGAGAVGRVTCTGEAAVPRLPVA